MVDVKDTVFLIDFHPDIKDMVEHTSNLNGHKIELIPDPEVALRLLEHIRPCAIVVDMFMPEIQSTAFLEQARRIQPNVPVIMLSSLPAMDERGQQLGAVATLQKPLSLQELIGAIERHCPTL